MRSGQLQVSDSLESHNHNPCPLSFFVLASLEWTRLESTYLARRLLCRFARQAHFPIHSVGRSALSDPRARTGGLHAVSGHDLMVQGFRSIASPRFALSSPLRALLHRRCHRVPRYDKRRPLGVNVKRMETGDGWGCTLKAEGGSKVASRLRAPAENPGAVAVNAALMADPKVACTPAGALVPYCTGSTVHAWTPVWMLQQPVEAR